MKKEIESGYTIHQIILSKSNFWRERNFTILEGVEPENEIDIKVDVEVDSELNKVGVFLTVKLDVKIKDTSIVVAEVVMYGFFEKTGESPVPELERFGKVNGASIMFAYVREHLSSLVSKAGLGFFALPPVNFTKI